MPTSDGRKIVVCKLFDEAHIPGLGRLLGRLPQREYLFVVVPNQTDLTALDEEQSRRLYETLKRSYEPE